MRSGGHPEDMLPIVALHAHDLTRRAVDGAGPADPRLDRARRAAHPRRGDGARPEGSDPRS
jgi:hypothetical protein